MFPISELKKDLLLRVLWSNLNFYKYEEIVFSILDINEVV